MTLVVTGPTHAYADEVNTHLITYGTNKLTTTLYTHDNRKFHTLQSIHGYAIHYIMIGTVRPIPTVIELLEKLTPEQLTVNPLITMERILSSALEFDCNNTPSTGDTDTTTLHAIIPSHNRLIRIYHYSKSSRGTNIRPLDDLGIYAHEGLDDRLIDLRRLLDGLPGIDVTLTTEQTFALGMLLEYDKLGDRYQVLDYKTGEVTMGLCTKTFIKTHIPQMFKQYPMLKGLIQPQYRMLSKLEFKGTM